MVRSNSILRRTGRWKPVNRGCADLDVLLDVRLCLVLSRICFRGWDVYPPLGHEIAGACGRADGSCKTMYLCQFTSDDSSKAVPVPEV